MPDTIPDTIPDKIPINIFLKISPIKYPPLIFFYVWVR